MYYPAFSTADKLFDSFFNSSAAESAMSPRTDVVNHGDKVQVQLELPGVAKEDITVNVENGVLSISGEKKSAHEVKQKDFYLSERGYGKFKRSFRLGEDLDQEDVQASFENGVLSLELKRKEAALPRQIEIK